MHESHQSEPKLERLDTLIESHPPAPPPLGFAARVMGHLARELHPVPFWQRPWVQWLATTLGLVLALGRLVGYILSAWLAVEVAG